MRASVPCFVRAADCSGPASVINYYRNPFAENSDEARLGYPRDAYYGSVARCAKHGARRVKIGLDTWPHLTYDYSLDVLLAEVGDELWCALECAWITLARMRDCGAA